MDRQAWCAVVHGVTKSQTWLSNWADTVQDRQRQWGLLFIGVALPGYLEIIKTLPRSFEHFLLWLDMIPSVHVQWMCSHVLEIKVQKWARPWLSAFQRQSGCGARQTCRHVISAQCHEHSDGVDTHTPHLCDVEDWKERCAYTWSETTKYRNLMWDVGFPGGSVVK